MPRSPILWRYWLPVAVWAALMVWFSTESFDASHTLHLMAKLLHLLWPTLGAETVLLLHLVLRKVAHVFEYFLFTFLLYRALRLGRPADRHWRWAGWALLVALAVSGLDELHQHFEPHRTGSVLDLGVDATGVLLAQMLLYWRHRRGRLRSGSRP